MKRDSLEKAIALLEARGGTLRERAAVLGFDGFVDMLASPIKSGDGNHVQQYFDTIGEFGQFLVERSGKSCSIELKEHGAKIGGNTPICANALGRLGVGVTCFGAFGYPEIHEQFREMSERCELIPVENPGLSIALEFADGKVMMAMNKGVNAVDWQTVKERAGLARLTASLDRSDLFGLLNWSELPGAMSIWRGLLEEVVPNVAPGKWVIFDLADCSRREPAECVEALRLVAAFGRSCRAVLSLNENEALSVCRLLLDEPAPDLEQAGAVLRERLGISLVVFHLHDRCMAFGAAGSAAAVRTRLVRHPKVTTGAGDNFNAGLCSALLMGLELPEMLAAASLAAGYYVAHGQSADLPEWIGYMREQLSFFN